MRSQVTGAGQGRRLFQGGAQKSLRQLWIGGRVRLLGKQEMNLTSKEGRAKCQGMNLDGIPLSDR